MGGKGTAQVATGSGGRRWKGIGSDSKRLEAEGRQRQRRGKMGGGEKAETAIGRGGRRRRGTGSDSKRWEVKGKHRQ